LFRLKESSIFKSYFVFTFLLIFFIVSALGYYFIDKENSEADEQIKKLESSLYKEKKELIVSEVKRIKGYLALEQNSTETALKSLVEEQASNAYAIASSIYEKNRGKKSDEQIKEDIKTALRGLKFFEGRGYVFVIGAKDGRWTLLPPDISKEGSSALGNKDDKNEDIFAKIRKAALGKRSGTFVKYRWYIPQTNTMNDKVSYVKYFAPYDWIIGSGEYTQTIDESLKKKTASRIIQMRFGDGGYSSIYQNDGKIVAIPTAASLSGESVYLTTDPIGQKAKDIVLTLIAQAQKGGGFYRYDWMKYESNTTSPKIAYAEEFKPWGWVIASSVYMDDIAKEIESRKQHIKDKHNEKLLAIGYLFSIAIIFSTVVLFALSVSFSRILRYYKTSLESRNRELEELNRTLEIKIAQEVEKSEQRQFLLIKQGRLAAMGEMIGNIAHQWRQPLNALGIIVQDFKMAFEYGELDKQYLDESVKKSKALIGYMSKTIDDFRNFFSPNKQKESFSVAAKINDTISFVSASFENNGIELVSELEDDSYINGYPNEFVQVVLNIVSNAKDAIVLHEIKNGFVKIKISKTEDKSKIEITDNGGGIPKDIIDKVFDPYFTTKDKGHGTGIGLYMSKVIIEDNMGGSIKIESAGTQTTVTILL